MTFKYKYQPSLLFFLLLAFSCIGIEREWEEIESNYDHMLNVFGILNLDTGYTSFIGLYRTTDLNEVSQRFFGLDTLFYCDCDAEDDERCWCEEGDEGYWVVDSIYEPAAIIKDASVFVTDYNGMNFEFTFVENVERIDTIMFDSTIFIDGYNLDFDTTIFDTNIFRLNFYIDTTGSFKPQEGQDYMLNISAPNFDPVTGFLTTPLKPQLNSVFQRGSVTDTIFVDEPFDISYDYKPKGKALVTAEVIFGEWWNDYSNTGWCGGYFDPFVVDLSDNMQNNTSIYPELCFSENEEVIVKDYVLRLTAIDDNYYEYFIIGEAGEYSNALLNYPTTRGRSIGISGGFGVFGAIASDWKFLKIKSN